MSNIAVIHDKEDYGKGFAEFVKKFIEDSGKARVVLFEGVTPGAVDYSAIVQKIKQSQADAVMFGGYYPEAWKIVSMIKRKKPNVVFISDNGVKDMTFIKVAGKNAEGVYASGPNGTTKNPISIRAFAEHKSIYNANAGAFYENAYAATLAAINALRATGGATDLPALIGGIAGSGGRAAGGQAGGTATGQIGAAHVGQPILGRTVKVRNLRLILSVNNASSLNWLFCKGKERRMATHNPRRRT